MSVGYFRVNLKKRILFLINPISGGISKKHLPELIQKHLDHNKFDDEIRYWTDEKNATEMTRSAVKEGFDVVVAAGGDGTINQVADGLRHSGVVMGILPRPERDPRRHTQWMGCIGVLITHPIVGQRLTL